MSDPWHYNATTRTLTGDGRCATFTPFEGGIVTLLASAQGCCVTHARIIRDQWPTSERDWAEAAIKVRVCRVRAKLAAARAHPQYQIPQEAPT